MSPKEAKELSQQLLDKAFEEHDGDIRNCLFRAAEHVFMAQGFATMKAAQESVVFYRGSTTDACAPDLHTVTEKEWQELMSRLRKLEAPPPGCSEEHGILSCLASPSAGSKEGRGK